MMDETTAAAAAWEVTLHGNGFHGWTHSGVVKQHIGRLTIRSNRAKDDRSPEGGGTHGCALTT